MPEGPELHLASLFVNKMCAGVLFTGPVTKSAVSKSPDVPFTCEAYRIGATSRGKEVKLTLTPMKSDDSKKRVKTGGADQPMEIVFRFGMSGCFRFTTEDELPKHAHLRFYAKEKPCRVLSFVDTRRFGSWQPNGTWQPDRGPCILFEYESFREKIVSHLSDRAFDRPICEAMLNQKYFNGIGNYLRAEILFRLNIPPFVPARTVLEGLKSEDLFENKKAVKNETADTKNSEEAEPKQVEEEPGDLLRLCHTVPLEVVNLGGKGYDPQKADYSGFKAWLQCYYVDGMKSIRDHNNRTMWFKGHPGPMTPKDTKAPKAKKRAKKNDDHDYTEKKKAVRSRSVSTSKKNVIKRETVTKTPKKEKASPSKEKNVIKRETVTKTPKKEKASPSKEAVSKSKREVKASQREKRETACRKKNSSAESTTGPQRRSERVTRQNST